MGWIAQYLLTIELIYEDLKDIMIKYFLLFFFICSNVNSVEFLGSFIQSFILGKTEPKAKVAR